MIKDFGWGRLSRIKLNPITNVYIREREREIWHTQKKTRQRFKWCGRRPRHTTRSWRDNGGLSPGDSGGGMVLPTLWFPISGLHNCERITSYCFSKPLNYGNLSQQPQETNTGRYYFHSNFALGKLKHGKMMDLSKVSGRARICTQAA